MNLKSKVLFLFMTVLIISMLYSSAKMFFLKGQLSVMERPELSVCENIFDEKVEACLIYPDKYKGQCVKLIIEEYS